MTVEWFGDRAVRYPLPDPVRRQVTVAALRAALPACSVRAGMDVVLVETAEPDPALLDAVCAVRIPGGEAVSDAGGRTVVIEVHYDGADLDECAAALGVPAPRLVDAHQDQGWEVAMMGFAPGFGYLVPVGAAVLDWAAVPRRSTPRTRVPMGSVAIAAGMSAVYPNALPGGWQLVGTTGMSMFDPADPQDPTALRPGDRVRFRAGR